MEGLKLVVAFDAQPWPTGWGYSDPVYVDYIDGEYFLLSPVHPGVQIAINVIL